MWHDSFTFTIDPVPVWRVTYKWVMSQPCQICTWVTSHMNEARHVWMSHVTYEWFMSHMKESCHTHRRVGVRQFFSAASWSRHTYKWAMSYIWIRHSTYDIWLSHITHMSHIVIWHIHTNKTYHWYEVGTPHWVISHIWMSHVAHANEWRHTSE